MNRQHFPWLVILGLFLLVLFLNPLGFSFLGAIFGGGEKGLPNLKNQDYTQNWMEDDVLVIDWVPINEQIAKSNFDTGGKYDIKSDGYIILIDDKVYKFQPGTGDTVHSDVCGDNGIGCLKSCIKFLSPEWFVHNGYAYPSETWVGGLTGGEHYVEYIIGNNQWAGSRCASWGKYFLTSPKWVGGAIINVGCPESGCRSDIPVVHCTTGSYNPDSDRCEYTISDVTYECPEGSVLEGTSCVADVLEIDCDGTFVDGKCYITPEIVHDCGNSAEWVEERGKCVSYETPVCSSGFWDEDSGQCVVTETVTKVVEKKEEAEKQKPKELPMEYIVIGGFVLLFLVLMFRRGSY